MPSARSLSPVGTVAGPTSLSPSPSNSGACPAGHCHHRPLSPPATATTGHHRHQRHRHLRIPPSPGHGTPRVAAAAGAAAAELRPAPRPRPALVPRVVPGGQAGPADPQRPPGPVPFGALPSPPVSPPAGGAAAGVRVPLPSRTPFPITPRSPSGCAAHRCDVTLRAAPSPRRRHAAGAEALPPGARPAPGARPGLRLLPGALPRLGPAGGAGAGPQDPARPPRQVQGGPGEAAAARGPRGAAGGAGAVPAVPAGAQRPPGGVQGRGAAEEAGGAPDRRGLARGAGGAPAADGLERGGERPAEGPQRGETQERRGGAEEEEIRDCRETGQENGGFPGGEGEGGSPAAGGSQKLHHPREPGGSDPGVPGQPPQLQLRHRQGRARRQAHGALLAALALVSRAPQNTQILPWNV